MFSIFSLAFLSLLACDKDEPLDTSSEWVDNDGDGYDTATDCDDNDDSIHPGASELCDGLDNNCDGQVDEDVIDGQDWFTDADLDGYGDPLTQATFCEVPEGDWVDNGMDCDDTDDAVNPLGVEVCDGIDNDCSGAVDDGVVDGQRYYADSDGDSFGDPESFVDECEAPSGYVDNQLDCDDGESLVNPDATEICNDGLDNDCDGTDNGCGVMGTFSLSSADITWTGSNDGDKLGGPVRSVGDLDGDGHPDLALSARGHGDSAGAIYLVDGPYAAGSYDIESVAYARIDGLAAGDELFAVTGINDFDSDGHPDFVVSARKSDSSHTDGGAVYLFLGAPSGDTSVSAAQISLRPEGDGDWAGILSFAGDVDGDGADDFLVGAQRNDSKNGAVYLITGGSITADADLADSAVIVRGNDGIQLGGGLAGVGDLDGDGLSDFIVGAPLDDTSSTDAGAVYVFSGQAGMSGGFGVGDADAALLGVSTNDQAGYGIGPAGDHNGDGYIDLLISATRSDLGGNLSGAVYLVQGPFSGSYALDAVAIATFTGQAEDDKMAPSYGTQDINGDGQLDILVAARSNSSKAGAAYLFLGPVSGTMPAATADGIFTGAAAGDGAGAPVNVPGDLNNDGLPDILIGARDAGDTDAGAAYVIFGAGL